ncbi:hypothetical protein [Streptomyces sp. NPDC059819]|uniref:hypothetical protein n=1 Tax=Streptomyces sp. NPDC059819 TaxID=3346963 RepID=UPI00365C1099
MTTADFRPTHVVPQVGLPAWEAPDVSRPTAPLDALLPVQLVDRLGDWGRIVCANGWSAWVDGRLLVAVPQDPPGASGPLTRTADPRPLLARTEDAVAGYRRAAEDLAGGSADGEAFRRRTRGLRVGVIVDGESVWLYDTEHERWVYCDGARLSTYATGEGPSVVGRGGGDGETAVVEGDADGGAGAGGVRVGGGAGPGETRVVEAAAAGSGMARPPVGEAPDRRGPGALGANAGGGAGPGETRVVEAAAAGSKAAPEPTQVVAVEADPGEAPAPSHARPASHGGRPALLLPPETADPDPDPAPPLRRGDG